MDERRRGRGPRGRRATSAGYAPRTIGSRKMRFIIPSTRRAASTSAGSVGSAGIAFVRLRVMPICSAPSSRRRVVARPWARCWWWMAASAAALVAATRGVHADGIAEQRGAERLVEGGPVLDAVTERRVGGLGVVGEPQGGVAVRPAALLLECLREVPVVEGEPGQDAGVEELVDEAAVEVEAGGVDVAVARLDARPAGGEAVGVEAQLAHDRDVAGGAVVVVDGDLEVVTVGDRAGHAGEGVPDGVLLAVLVRCALDLGGGGGRSPEERRQEQGRSGGGLGGVRHRSSSWLGARPCYRLLRALSCWSRVWFGWWRQRGALT